MRICVTGGAGFVASHLCERLLSEGHEVIAVDNYVTGAKRNVATFLDNPRFTLIEADVSKELPVEGKLDRVFHMASPASPIDYVELPFATLHAGSDATELALERCVTDGARFFLASTSEVYGDPAVHPQVESYWGNVNPIGPRSVYDEAKRYAEALTMAYQRYKGVETRIIRIFNTYGPRMRPNDGRVVPAFCGQALEGKPLTVFGDGTQTRSFCYVSDLVDGIIRLMESDLGTPCNVGNPSERTMLELAAHINEYTGNQAGIIHKPLPKDDPTRRKPDISLARERLGWEPKIEFADGMARTVEYFREVLAK
ncbi:MAG: SDR family oxidoreductase [Proteobacteria bacterium]|nr:SDR family oxidoreductase [Pseudomonadota bacterium]MCP4918520.1 SDR family oxidoreductase [Pseudomonadota bacterium]